ncbi:MAG: Asp-tRNA(Asn)/Glu-tRNA(Gln) amidotransferase subunit GatA [Chthonomonas sp.]|nr:Asp-tRNA(Asn)/Glu-tRNA(Gln) amidotransferase subunit GatA [Chthonomonas sp.]
MSSLTELSATEIGALLRSRGASVIEVAQAFASKEDTVGAFITRSAPDSEACARAQVMIDAGEGSALTGVPIALKDNISTRGLLTTCASRILSNYIPPYNAMVVDKLESQGLISLGKTNLDEFAFGASTETSAYHVTRNPWDLERSPGGSSGGSAAAVAAHLSPVALGSDTGGSIRQPASLCGIVGYKPTYGRVSRYGLVAFASSLDQIGPFGRSVEDCAHLAAVISGHDHHDATSLPTDPISARDLKTGSLKGKRIAIPSELFDDSAEPGVLASVDSAIQALKGEGVEFVPVSIPEITVGVTTYYIIAPAEASSNLARFDGVRFGPRESGDGHVNVVAETRGKLFGKEVRTRIVVGTYVLSAGYYDAYYLRAQQVRGKMAAKFEQVLSTCDAILSPTSPCVAFKIGELEGDPLALKLLDYCTIPANMGGFPAISLPCGLSDGLPVGLQLLGGISRDEDLLQLAYSVEQCLGVKITPPKM